MLTKAQREQLDQLRAAGFRGVRSGDLINKPITRDLVQMRLADNSGGSPASLSTVYITKAGRDALKA